MWSEKTWESRRRRLALELQREHQGKLLCKAKRRQPKLREPPDGRKFRWGKREWESERLRMSLPLHDYGCSLDARLALPLKEPDIPLEFLRISPRTLKEG